MQNLDAISDISVEVFNRFEIDETPVTEQPPRFEFPDLAGHLSV
jgi:hypothetical protein